MSPPAPRKTAARPGDEHGTPRDRFLLKLVDGALAGCIFVVPLLMGGRQALGQLVLVSLAVIAALAWTVRQCLQRESQWRHTPAMFLLLAGVALLVVQLVPLPQPILQWVAPHTARILPMWNADSSLSLGTWTCLSLTPAATRGALALFLAYGLLFLVTIQRIRDVADVERLLRWIAISALMMAGFGLAQLLTSNGKFFWFYEHPFSDTRDGAKGSFTNRNHFAHFLALGIGPLIWWLQENLLPRRRRNRRNARVSGPSTGDFQTSGQVSGLRTVALGLVLFAGLTSLSRGGMAVTFIAVAICVAVCYRAKTLGKRFVLSMAATALLIGALLTIYGSDQVGSRLDELSSGSIETLDQESGRRLIWATVVRASADFALLGSGVGSHREVYPMYLEQPAMSEYTHAENGPLQALLETGAVGLTLVLAGVGFCACWCIGGLRRAGSKRALVCIGAISASLTVSVVHSLADFVWYVPACMALVAIMAGCACRLRQSAANGKQSRLKPWAMPKPVVATMAVALLVVGTWMIVGRVGPTLAEPHWDRYRILAMAAARPAPAEETESSVPVTPQQVREASLEAIARMIDELEQVVRWDPDHARARLRLAEAYLRRFDLAQQASENPMPLAQIRDAVIQARAAARDEQTKREVEQWLARTISSQGNCIEAALQHARRSLELCPLQGEGYLCLAELCFLDTGHPQRAKSAYVGQALQVRPLGGAVLFEAGREAWLAGDYSQGMQYWQHSFRCGRKHQLKLIELLAGRVPVGFLLEGFQPDLVALRMLHKEYSRFHLPEDLTQLRRCYAGAALAKARTLDEEEDAAQAWLEAGWLYHLLEQSDRALDCARNAFARNPNDYNVRHAMALRLADQQQFAEAETHVDWCLQRRPNDKRLQDLRRRIVVGRIDGEDAPRVAALPQDSLP